MKFLYSWFLLFSGALTLQAQNLVGVEEDTLTLYKNLYKAHFNQNQYFSAPKGTYFLIFEQCIDYSKLSVTVFNSLDMPVVANRYNGYYMFNLDTNRTFQYKINYHGEFCDSVYVLAKIFSPTPPIIDRNAWFNLNDFKSNLGNRNVSDKPMLFLFWNTSSKTCLDYYHFFNDLSVKYDEFVYIFYSDEYKNNLDKYVKDNYKSNVVFINDKFYKIGQEVGAFSLPMILMLDRNNNIIYKNRIVDGQSAKIRKAVQGKIDSLLSAHNY